MYLRIIRRDLKRRKAMNAILLIFMLLASMFVSSGANNILAITGAVDDFFEKSNMPDLMANVMGHEGEDPLGPVLDEMDCVTGYEYNSLLVVTMDNLRINGEKPNERSFTSSIFGFEDSLITVFDKNNHPIETMEPGTVYLGTDLMNALKIQPGDTLELVFDDLSKEFRVLGPYKDATGGCIMVSKSDLQPFLEYHANNPSIRVCYYAIRTTDISTVKQVLNKHYHVMGVYDAATMKTSYIMDMVLAGIMLVVSLCRVIVAFVMLRVTIQFTLSEEFRQIGVLKAIGIPNLTIRGLYLSKYTLLAVLGAVLGFFGSIPFGNTLLYNVSQSIVMESSAGYLTNGVCCAGVVVVTLLFCFGCTRKVGHFTPVDAIRNGTTGERFHRKGLLKLSKTPGRPAFFMALNDVLSSPKRFSMIMLLFALCLSLVLMMVNSVNTLRSDQLITSFGMQQSDLYLIKDVEGLLDLFAADGKEKANRYLEDMEQTLKDEGMPAECSVEVMMMLLVSNGDTEYKATIWQGVGNQVENYCYYEGTPPRYQNEIAITEVTARTLGVQIGDTVTIHMDEGDQNFIITALFQSMMNMGEGIRVHQDAPIGFQHLAGICATQIDFSEELTAEQLRLRMGSVRELLNTDELYTAGEYVDEMVDIADTLESIQNLTLLVVLIIVAMVPVLMAKSFITKERGDSATL